MRKVGELMHNAINYLLGVMTGAWLVYAWARGAFDD